MPVIELTRLTKRFPGVVALRDLSLTVEPGEAVCVMGPNGSGKTTCLRLLAGLLTPTSGRVLVDGREPASAPAAWRARIGVALSDRPGLYDRLTGRENLLFFARLQGIDRRRAAGVIDQRLVELGVQAPDRAYQEYSAGAKQRLLLARALLHDPPVLLLDEPTKSLDTAGAEQVPALLAARRRAQGGAIVLTTHTHGEAEQLADRVVVLSGAD